MYLIVGALACVINFCTLTMVTSEYDLWKAIRKNRIYIFLIYCTYIHLIVIITPIQLNVFMLFLFIFFSECFLLNFSFLPTNNKDIGTSQSMNWIWTSVVRTILELIWFSCIRMLILFPNLWFFFKKFHHTKWAVIKRICIWYVCPKLHLKRA